MWRQKAEKLISVHNAQTCREKRILREKRETDRESNQIDMGEEEYSTFVILGKERIMAVRSGEDTWCRIRTYS